MEAVYSIFWYLAKHENSRIAFDDRRIECKEEDFSTVEWTSQHTEVMKEEMPPNMPEPRGRPLRHTIFVDADHAGIVVKRRSQTGIVQFLNGAPIDWYSKKRTRLKVQHLAVSSMRYGQQLTVALHFGTSYGCLVFLSMGRLASTAIMKVWSRMPPYRS